MFLRILKGFLTVQMDFLKTLGGFLKILKAGWLVWLPCLAVSGGKVQRKSPEKLFFLHFLLFLLFDNAIDWEC